MNKTIEIARAKELFVKTPVISRIYNFKGSDEKIQVYFKLECLQPSGSFKDRGIGHMISILTEARNVDMLISSSGGNAGHAVACIGQKLHIPVRVYVPVTTKPIMIQKIQSTGAEVLINGANWNEADSFARLAVATNPNARYIPPFDDAMLWDGHASIIDELQEYFGPDDYPDDIILSVGGGGLLAGVQRGLTRVGWTKTRINAVETTGAASFAAAKAAGKIVILEKISTIATTLGALAVTSATLESDIVTESVIVSDEEAVTASCYFADDYRMMVEPACGAALSLVMLDSLRHKHYHHVSSSSSSNESGHGMKKVVVIVCGGSAVSVDLLHEWKDAYVIPYERSIV